MLYNKKLISSKKILIFITFVTIFFSNFINVYSIEPEIFIQSTVNRAAETLGGDLTKEERIQKLKEIAKETVDIRGIGLYSLGAYRKNLNDAQKKNMKNYLNNIF